jgi:hypothetical protein
MKPESISFSFFDSHLKKCPVAEIHFFRWGGAKPPKFPTKLSNFRQTPQFALEKAVFSPLLGQNFRKFVIFREGGGAVAPPRPTKIYATGNTFSRSPVSRIGGIGNEPRWTKEDFAKRDRGLNNHSRMAMSWILLRKHRKQYAAL